MLRLDVATLIAGMAIAAWPAVDRALIGRVGTGSTSTLDWVPLPSLPSFGH